jgi:hypothetical protein
MIYDHKLPTCVLLQCVDRWSISSNIKCSIVKNPTMLGNCNESRLLKPWCLKKTYIYIYIWYLSIYLSIYLAGGIPTPLNNKGSSSWDDFPFPTELVPVSTKQLTGGVTLPKIQAANPAPGGDLPSWTHLIHKDAAITHLQSGGTQGSHVAMERSTHF